LTEEAETLAEMQQHFAEAKQKADGIYKARISYDDPPVSSLRLKTVHGVSPTKVRKVPQDFCQQSGAQGFSAIPELPRRDLV
jgi:hypothetical protein